MMQIKGPAICYLRDNINTDEIIPARYLTTSDPDELASHCMEDLDPDFAARDVKGSILVTAANFGCGSSREHAPIAIQARGIVAILANSYARIFFRNAINIGLPIFECPDVGNITEGDQLEVDATAGVVCNLTKDEQYPIAAMPEFLQDLIAAGGLVPWARQRLAQK
jgi:3-isopropylmalate/(R)-2-methylmalate dehydratase small subunit